MESATAASTAGEWDLKRGPEMDLERDDWTGDDWAVEMAATMACAMAG